MVLSINVHAFGKVWALPVLVGLYRSKKRWIRDKCPSRKTTELAREMVHLLATTLPDRRVMVVGDAAYTNGALMKRRPPNVQLIGRSRPDAALYAPAPRYRGRVVHEHEDLGSALPEPALPANTPDGNGFG